MHRLFRSADSGAAFIWQELVHGFWGDCDTAVKVSLCNAPV
jgi:hypothetical protein